jgi:hypothetical protein
MGTYNREDNVHTSWLIGLFFFLLTESKFKMEPTRDYFSLPAQKRISADDISWVSLSIHVLPSIFVAFYSFS